MSNKFNELLDLLVNEENDKAEELFHDIVVEKSRDIYNELVEQDVEDVKIEDYQICPLEVRDPDFFDSNIRQEVLGFRICRTTKEEKWKIINSSKDRVKANKEPAITPGKIIGRVILINVITCLPPKS